MRKITLALSLVSFASVAFASPYPFDKRVNLDILQQELKDGGFNVDHIRCSGTKCTIFWGAGGEAKNPAAIINNHQYIDLEKQRAEQRDSMRALADKWRQGTITPAEKDELLLKFILFYLR